MPQGKVKRSPTNQQPGQIQAPDGQTFQFRQHDLPPGTPPLDVGQSVEFKQAFRQGEQWAEKVTLVGPRPPAPGQQAQRKAPKGQPQAVSQKERRREREGRTPQPQSPYAPARDIPGVVREVIGRLRNDRRSLHKVEVKTLVRDAEELGRFFARESHLVAGQIRRFLGTIIRLRTALRLPLAEWDEPAPPLPDLATLYRQVIMLKPQLAEAAGRERRIEPLRQVLEACVDRVKRETMAEDLAVLADFVTAILAYHRYYGGGEFSHEMA